MKKSAFIALALFIISGLIYLSRKPSPVITKQLEQNHTASVNQRAKPAMSIQVPKAMIDMPSKEAEQNSEQDKEIQISSDQSSLSPTELQKLSREKFGDFSNINVPRYEDYGDDDKILYLYIMSLGAGRDFSQNLKTYTAPLKAVKKSDELKRFWSELVGEWKGDFISEKVKDQDASAYFSLSITESGFKVALRDANQIYLMTESANYAEDVLTGIHQQLPKNLVITLKAKPELGYKHNIYLQIFPSQSHDVLLGGMYNTDQWVDTEHYVLADKLYFQRVSGP